MYFLYNKSLDAFYGKGAVWIPKSVIKSDIKKLCVFGDMYEAKECIRQEHFRPSVIILNEKSLKSRVGLKKITDTLLPNWHDGYSFAIIQAGAKECMEGDTEHSEEVEPASSGVSPENKDDRTDQTEHLIYEGSSILENPSVEAEDEKRMTYVEYLEQLDAARVIYNGDRPYIQSSATDTMDTQLIRDTIEYLAKTKDILRQWSEKMAKVEADIRGCDLQIADELHILEICTDLTEDEMLDSAKRLRTVRRERRVSKNEQEIGKILLPTIQTGLNIEKIENLEKCIMAQKERVYRIRNPKAVVQMTEQDKRAFAIVGESFGCAVKETGKET